MAISASIHARWGHRVDGLVHTHAWRVAATVTGPVDADKIYPADDLERALDEIVGRWRGHYLTHEDTDTWKGFAPLRWDREPTVEEIVRRIWAALEPIIAGHHPDVALESVSLEEAAEFDRCRMVTLSRS